MEKTIDSKNLQNTSKILLIVHALFLIVSAFANIFLVIYFFNLLENNILKLIIYYIIVGFSTAITSIILGKLLKDKSLIKLYRIALLEFFLYFLGVLYLKQNLISVFYLFAIFYGIVYGTYWLIYEVMIYELAKKEEFKIFFSYTGILSQIISIITPFIIGYVVYELSYYVVIIILAIVLFIAYLISLKLPLDLAIRKSTNILGFIKKIRIEKNTKQKAIFFLEHLSGLTYKGVWTTIMPLFIYIIFNNEFTLGKIVSIASFISIILLFIIGKYLKQKYMDNVTVICYFIMIISLIFLIIMKDNFFVVLFNILSIIVIELARTTQRIYLFKIPKEGKLVDNSVEYFNVTQIIVDSGRIIGYSLFALLYIGFGNQGIVYMFVINSLFLGWISYILKRL